MSISSFKAEVRARLSAATPGPWSVNQYLGFDVWDFAQRTRVAKCDPREDYLPGKTSCWANSDLIANAPTDLARLLAMVEVYEAALEYYAKDTNWIHGCTPKTAMKALASADNNLSKFAEDLRRERDELLLNIEQSEPQFKTLIRERGEANEAAAGSALLVQSSRERLTSALAAIGHLRSAARNLITAWCDGEDIVTAVGALEFALSISEFAEDLRQKYQALLPPSSD